MTKEEIDAMLHELFKFLDYKTPAEVYMVELRGIVAQHMGDAEDPEEYGRLL